MPAAPRSLLTSIASLALPALLASPVASAAEAPFSIVAEPAPALAAEEGPHRHTVYLNFDGGEISHGTNAAEMQALCGSLPAQIPAFTGTDAARQEIVEIFEQAVAPFGIRVAHEAPPPKHLPYSMILIGGTVDDLGLPGATSSVACVTDCADKNQRDTSFVFSGSYDDPRLLAQAALKVAGHTWGLDSLQKHEMLMNWAVSEDPRTWAGRCEPIEDTFATKSCDYVHEDYCGEDSGMQNDVAELTAVFGLDSPDVTPPTVTLLSPADGAVIEPGSAVMIEAEVSDDFGGVGWHLVIPELGQDLPAYKRETTWNAKLPEGTYTIRVEALDHDGNITSDQVTVHVGEPPAAESTGEPIPDDPTTGAPDEPDTTGAPTSGPDPEESTGAPETEGDTAAPGGAADESGCSCSSGQGASDMSLALLGLGALLSLRRRR